MSRLLDADEITRQLTDLPGWHRHGDTLVTSLRSSDFLAAIRLVDEVALVAEDMCHHPDIAISHARTSWTLSTHSVGGITQLDVELAHRIREAAALSGAQPVTGDASAACCTPASRVKATDSHRGRGQ